MGADDDETLRILPAKPPRSSSRPALAAGAIALGLAAAVGAAWYGLGRDAAPPPQASSTPPALPAPVPPRPATPLAREAELAAFLPDQPVLRRLAENPRIFVLLFPDLDIQGAALNRAAALIEKAGLPRDRLLSQVELEAVIARSGDTAATWFLGHDYRAADLTRFFALAARDRILLGEAEAWVRDQLAIALAEAGPDPVALISAAGPDGRMDAAMRATVLRHEIGHGHYFTVPGFADHIHRVWRGAFTEAERAAFRAFLGREGYDPTNEDLMANETMAYLLFTPDPRFFAPPMVGMTDPDIERLRRLLRDGLPRP